MSIVTLPLFPSCRLLCVGFQSQQCPTAPAHLQLCPTWVQIAQEMKAKVQPALSLVTVSSQEGTLKQCHQINPWQVQSDPSCWLLCPQLRDPGSLVSSALLLPQSQKGSPAQKDKPWVCFDCCVLDLGVRQLCPALCIYFPSLPSRRAQCRCEHWK